MRDDNAIERPDVLEQLLERFQNTVFTAKQYDLLIDTGLLEDLPFELIDGRLALMAPHSHEHTYASQRLLGTLSEQIQYRNRAIVRKSEPISLKDGTWRPEPDLCVVSGDEQDYYRYTPTPKDILLLVEVSKSTIKRDTGKKLKVYASEGIKEYWIVNVLKQNVRVLRNPEGGSFKSDATRNHGIISPLAFPGCTVSVQDLF